MTSGQLVYFICDDTVEIVRFLSKDQLSCIIDFYGDTQRVKEENLTVDTNVVIQHIDKRISMHESKIAVLKACRQEFKPLRLE